MKINLEKFSSIAIFSFFLGFQCYLLLFCQYPIATKILNTNFIILVIIRRLNMTKKSSPIWQVSILLQRQLGGGSGLLFLGHPVDITRGADMELQPGRLASTSEYPVLQMRSRFSLRLGATSTALHAGNNNVPGARQLLGAIESASVPPVGVGAANPGAAIRRAELRIPSAALPNDTNDRLVTGTRREWNAPWKQWIAGRKRCAKMILPTGARESFFNRGSRS